MQGYEHAKRATLAFLDSFKEKADPDDRELLRCVARTSLRTKLYEELADQLTDIVVDAVLTIRKPEEAIDLFMVSLPDHVLGPGDHKGMQCPPAGSPEPFERRAKRTSLTCRAMYQAVLCAFFIEIEHTTLCLGTA